MRIPHHAVAVEEDAPRLLDETEDLSQQTDLRVSSARLPEDHGEGHLSLEAPGCGFRLPIGHGDDHLDVVRLVPLAVGDHLLHRGVALGARDRAHEVDEHPLPAVALEVDDVAIRVPQGKDRRAPDLKHFRLQSQVMNSHGTC